MSFYTAIPYLAWSGYVYCCVGSPIGVSRDAFYKAEKRVNKQCLQEALVLGEVREIKKEQDKLGTEKVYLLIKPFLTDHCIKMGRDKLYDLLRTYHLLPKRRRKRLHRQSDWHHAIKAYVL